LSNIEQIDKEITALTPRQDELERNISFHKKANTVPLVNEHRKAKAELSKIKARLILINADRKRAEVACNQITEIIEKFKRDHMELLRLSEDNVLRVLFGANRGKK
jgi:hypothetical protein